MTKNQMRATLKRMGWNQTQAARRLGVSPPAVNRWVNGNRPIPGPIAILLKRLASK